MTNNFVSARRLDSGTNQTSVAPFLLSGVNASTGLDLLSGELNNTCAVLDTSCALAVYTPTNTLFNVSASSWFQNVRGMRAHRTYVLAGTR